MNATSRQIIGMTTINAEEIRALRIPLPEDLGTQEALLADLDAARAARDAELEASNSALAGLDAFILAELRLALPPPPDPTRPFAVTRAVLASGGKLFPNYYNQSANTQSPRFMRSAPTRSPPQLTSLACSGRSRTANST